jgi:hypothetical protein
MDFGTIAQGLVGLALALGGGAAGQAVGKLPNTGVKALNKVLAPATAIAVGTLYQGITGDSAAAGDIVGGGIKLGVGASGVYTVLKNAKEFIKLF